MVKSVSKTGVWAEAEGGPGSGVFALQAKNLKLILRIYI